ncbi:MAG: translation initiation factor IF-2 N-terminal domain-containing protein, partial [Clostridiales bacterium]|nr:translation initiation factor IF-2 N-terminal domain-containing protein [Clostridiales bacterium]
MEQATKLQAQLQGFMLQIGERKGEVQTLLETARAAEDRLLEKEQVQRRERLERERAERLQKMLESDEATGVHVGGDDREEAVAEETPAEKPEQTAERVVFMPDQPAPRAPRPPVARTTDTRPPAPRTPGRAPAADTQRRGPTLQTGVSRPGMPKPGERAVSFPPSGPPRSGPPRSGNYDRDRRSKNKKALQKEAAPSMNAWDDNIPGSRKVKGRKQALQYRPEPIIIEHAIITTETISVKDLCEKIGKPAAELIKKLFLLDIPATINQELDFDTAVLIAGEYNITLEQQLTKTFEDVLADTAEDTDAPET